MKAFETPEEKRARRLAKKEAKERKKREKMGWGEEYIIADNNIMVCISKLRAKLNEDDPTAYIKTIRGLGYRMEK